MTKTEYNDFIKYLHEENERRLAEQEQKRRERKTQLYHEELKRIEKELAFLQKRRTEVEKWLEKYGTEEGEKNAKSYRSK